jgi:hypothetical protein
MFLGNAALNSPLHIIAAKTEPHNVVDVNGMSFLWTLQNRAIFGLHIAVQET